MRSRNEIKKDLGEGFTKKETVRPLYVIAAEIFENWQKPYFGAVPYLKAMYALNSMDDMYGFDSADMIVRYFLSNATTWRGETARRVKSELKSMLKS
jgi:hypothetical protein